MKVFAIQTTSNITQHKQTDSTNQPPTPKINLSQDKFVSKVGFGSRITDIFSERRLLKSKLEAKEITEEVYNRLVKPLDDEIQKIEDNFFTYPSAEPKEGVEYTLEDELWHRWNG